MYHSLSFLQQHFHVSLIGYPGSALLPALLSHPAFTPVYLPLPLATPRWAFVVAGPVKVIWQCAVVLWVLMTLPDPPEFILVQVRRSRCSPSDVLDLLALCRWTMLTRSLHCVPR